MKEFINSNGGMVGAIVLVLVCVNIALTAIKSVLEKLMPTPEKQASSSFYKGVCSVMTILTQAIDWLTGNKAH